MKLKNNKAVQNLNILLPKKLTIVQVGHQLKIKSFDWQNELLCKTIFSLQDKYFKGSMLLPGFKIILINKNTLKIFLGEANQDVEISSNLVVQLMPCQVDHLLINAPEITLNDKLQFGCQSKNLIKNINWTLTKSLFEIPALSTKGKLQINVPENLSKTIALNQIKAADFVLNAPQCHLRQGQSFDLLSPVISANPQFVPLKKPTSLPKYVSIFVQGICQFNIGSYQMYGRVNCHAFKIYAADKITLGVVQASQLPAAISVQELMLESSSAVIELQGLQLNVYQKASFRTPVKLDNISSVLNFHKDLWFDTPMVHHRLLLKTDARGYCQDLVTHQGKINLPEYRGPITVAMTYPAIVYVAGISHTQGQTINEGANLLMYQHLGPMVNLISPLLEDNYIVLDHSGEAPRLGHKFDYERDWQAPYHEQESNAEINYRLALKRWRRTAKRFFHHRPELQDFAPKVRISSKFQHLKIIQAKLSLARALDSPAWNLHLDGWLSAPAIRLSNISLAFIGRSQVHSNPEKAFEPWRELLEFVPFLDKFCNDHNIFAPRNEISGMPYGNEDAYPYCPELFSFKTMGLVPNQQLLKPYLSREQEQLALALAWQAQTGCCTSDVKSLHKKLVFNGKQYFDSNNVWSAEAPAMLLYQEQSKTLNAKAQQVLVPVLFTPEKIDVPALRQHHAVVKVKTNLSLQGNARQSAALQMTGHLDIQGKISIEQFNLVEQQALVKSEAIAVNNQLSRKSIGFKRKTVNHIANLAMSKKTASNTVKAAGLEYREINKIVWQSPNLQLGLGGLLIREVTSLNENALITQDKKLLTQKVGLIREKFYTTVDKIDQAILRSQGPVSIQVMSLRLDSLDIVAPKEELIADRLIRYQFIPSFEIAEQAKLTDQKKALRKRRKAFKKAQIKQHLLILVNMGLASLIGPGSSFISQSLFANVLLANVLDAAILSACHSSVLALAYRKPILKTIKNAVLSASLSKGLGLSLDAITVSKALTIAAPIQELGQLMVQNNFQIKAAINQYGGNLLENVVNHHLVQKLILKPPVIVKISKPVQVILKEMSLELFAGQDLPSSILYAGLKGGETWAGSLAKKQQSKKLVQKSFVNKSASEDLDYKALLALLEIPLATWQINLGVIEQPKAQTKSNNIGALTTDQTKSNWLEKLFWFVGSAEAAPVVKVKDGSELNGYTCKLFSKQTLVGPRLIPKNHELNIILQNPEVFLNDNALAKLESSRQHFIRSFKQDAILSSHALAKNKNNIVIPFRVLQKKIEEEQQQRQKNMDDFNPIFIDEENLGIKKSFGKELDGRFKWRKLETQSYCHSPLKSLFQSEKHKSASNLTSNHEVFDPLDYTQSYKKSLAKPVSINLAKIKAQLNLLAFRQKQLNLSMRSNALNQIGVDMLAYQHLGLNVIELIWINQYIQNKTQLDGPNAGVSMSLNFTQGTIGKFELETSLRLNLSAFKLKTASSFKVPIINKSCEVQASIGLGLSAQLGAGYSRFNTKSGGLPYLRLYVNPLLNNSYHLSCQSQESLATKIIDKSKPKKASQP